MEQTEQQGLFDSKLNETGKIYIRKFAILTRILILFGVLLSLVFLIENIIRVISFNPSLFSSNKALQFQYRIFPFYSLIYTVLAMLQLYYYWKVGKYLTKGADSNDETAFNESFRALYRNAVFGIIIFLVALFMGLLDLYVLIEYYRYLR